jgi:N6-L-threonylcarbamoyladenine synthase
MTFFLGIETSCDETAAAVFTDEPRVLSNVVASQTDLHAKFGGVVPEVAARAHLQRLLPVIDEALSQAKVTLDQIGAIAVHNTPGLVGALLVGLSAAKALSVALDVPLIAVNHVHAHVYACRVAAGRDIFPCVGLVVSGGHTALFHCRTAIDLELLGTTRDDAAGEAFDKVAAILGLGFPGGPAVEREAAVGDPSAYKFPRSMLEESSLDFSFSGLKTAVLYATHGQPSAPLSAASPPKRARGRKDDEPPTGHRRADLAASFQQAVVEVLVLKSRKALRRTGLKHLAVGGGVSANRALRTALEAMCAAEGAELFIPPMELCTDNAAMAALAVEKWRRQDFAPLDLDAVPYLW